MKIRTGFVSNSSSSSFTCEICGLTESGYDQGPRDLGYYSCVREHVFCECHLVEVDLDAVKENVLNFIIERNAKNAANGYKSDKMTEEVVLKMENTEELISLFYNNYYGVPSICCPICSLETVRDYDLLNYVLKMSNMTKEKLIEQLKKDHPTFEEMVEFIYGYRK